MRSLGVILLALFGILALVQSGSISLGNRNWYDQLLLRQNIFIHGNQWQPRPSFNLTYPARGSRNSSKVINFIQIRDLTRYQNGGSPILLSGGIGFKHVNILLKSQTSNGLNVTAEIWGR
ncbi:uncharacterized protein LOC129610440 [Condylostylus longicornis]|uniref:uncharacterized protein LOC129610440 n=1 Tax=Condylostylus longicornis TaxID=2530218 RepID=UPI00244E247B|nr:uncharacterized protein LOC129610440 [Condylostylus longicornis]